MDERKKVLELVAAGHLTIDEGDRILEALDAAVAPAAPETPATPFPPAPMGESFMGERLYNAITATIEKSLGEGRVRTVRGRRGGRGRGVDEIVSFASLGISPDYVREMRDLFDESELDTSDLTSLSTMGVSVDYVSEMRDLFDAISPREITSLAALGVSPDWVEEIKDNFDDDLDYRDIMRIAPLGISADYIRELIASGIEDLDVDEVIKRRMGHD